MVAGALTRGEPRPATRGTRGSEESESHAVDGEQALQPEMLWMRGAARSSRTGVQQKKEVPLANRRTPQSPALSSCLSPMGTR